MNHIHESPKSMAIPLIVLAVLSFAGGFMNIPEALGGSNSLQEYLSPVLNAGGNTALHHLDHATEYLLMAIVVGLHACRDRHRLRSVCKKTTCSAGGWAT